MTVQTDLDTIWSDSEQTRDTLKVRATLENCTNVIVETDQAIQRIVDSGDFALIPAELQTTYTNWWDSIKTARASIEADVKIGDAKDWTPPDRTRTR